MMIYDPRGVIDAPKLSKAPRPTSLGGRRLGVLDNTKWNGWKLEQRVAALLEERFALGRVTRYKKESFSRVAAPELLAQIVAENDLVLTGIGD
ncbi:MAG: hypothetical protein JO101_03670 [Candidatus Eremiobacteraeota bacterium]|nr:hypothetical protein [Candidatus Eremiobacteraeota bacterium]MBV8354392.1 hypothetical protein [Candidatus Eremiobacteraeota bacterium]